MAEKVSGPASYFPSIEKTYGKSIDYWMKQLNKTKDMKHMDAVNWLKSERGIGHGHANALVAVFRKENGIS